MIIHLKKLVLSRILVGVTLLALLICVPYPPGFAKMEELPDSDLKTVTAREGLVLDLDLAFGADAINIKDESGWASGTGDPGAFRLANFFLGDIDGQDAYTLNNFTIDADGNDGVVFDLPTGNLLEGEASEVYLGSPSTSAGSLELQDLNVGPASLSVSGENDGLTVDSEFFVLVDELSLTDNDGTLSNGNSGLLALGVDNGADFSIDDGAGNSATLTNLTVNADANDGLVVDWFEGQATYNIGAIQLGGTPSATSFKLINGDMTGTSIEISGHGGGVTLSGTLDVSADAFQLSDSDGAPCLYDGDGNGTAECSDGGGTPTQLKLSGFEISDGSNNAATPNDGGAQLSDARVDFDGIDGAVLTLPAGPMEISADALSTGDAEIADGYPGFSLNNLNLDNSWVAVDPHS